MSFLDSIRSKRSREPDGDSPETALAEGDQSLVDRFARLGERDAVQELVKFNQAELAVIEDFERSHRARKSVLDKLYYLRQPEPLPDYDSLEPAAISSALEGAPVETVKAVRDYERKHQNRTTVNKEVLGTMSESRARMMAETAEANGLPIKDEPESGLGTP
jgi:hypothetical protein